MAKLTREQAIEKLGDYAFNQRTKEVIESRVKRLQYFCENNDGNIEIRLNNNWSKAPAKSQKYCLLGGTTYRYQVWAVIK